ncbi:hypothetical protein MK852_14445 [Shewanella benthica]|nr:hypothetical protein [Shewanella benthica]
MNLSFIESLQEGQAEADDYVKNKIEVDAILKSVETSLKEFLGDESIKVCYAAETVVDEKKLESLSKNNNGLLNLGNTIARLNAIVETGYTSIYLRKEVVNGDSSTMSSSETLFSYKFGEQVYPLEVRFRNNSFFCSGGEALISMIRKLLSEGHTIRLLRSF